MPDVRAYDAGAGRGHDLDRDDIEGIDLVPRSNAAAVVARMRSRGPPSASSTIRREPPKPVSASSRASAAGAAPSEVSASTRAPGCRCGRTRSSARACSETSAVSGSAQPSRAAARLNADGAGTTSISCASTWRASTAPTPCMKGSPEASTQTCRPRWRQNLFDDAVERRRPRPRRAADERCRQRQMPPAAEHDVGAADQPAGDRAQPVDAVLADADDGQPARRCGSVRRQRISKRHEAHPHSRRHHGSAAARRAPGRAPRSRGDAVARRPHRRAGAAAGSGAGRRIRRRGRPRRLARERRRSTS